MVPHTHTQTKHPKKSIFTIVLNVVYKYKCKNNIWYTHMCVLFAYSKQFRNAIDTQINANSWPLLAAVLLHYLDREEPRWHHQSS